MRSPRGLTAAAGSTLAVSGAVLAFSLQPGRPPNWTALGWIVLIAGLAVLMALGAAHLPSAAKSSFPVRRGASGEEQSAESGSARTAPQGDRALGGLVAVVVGILAVLIIGVVTLALLEADADNSSTVAIATSAFGVISAVVGAYLGVKIGAEQTHQASRNAAEAVGQAQETTREATRNAAEAVNQAREASTNAAAAVDQAREATRTARDSNAEDQRDDREDPPSS